MGKKPPHSYHVVCFHQAEFVQHTGHHRFVPLRLVCKGAALSPNVGPRQPLRLFALLSAIPLPVLTSPSPGKQSPTSYKCPQRKTTGFKPLAVLTALCPQHGSSPQARHTRARRLADALLPCFSSREIDCSTVRAAAGAEVSQRRRGCPCPLSASSR